MCGSEPVAQLELHAHACVQVDSSSPSRAAAVRPSASNCISVAIVSRSDSHLCFSTFVSQEPPAELQLTTARVSNSDEEAVLPEGL